MTDDTSSTSISTLESRGRESRLYFTADELLGTDFPEPRWAVPGLIPEGLTVFAGPPKWGKSWLVLGMGECIASGKPVLGKLAVDSGPVLYAALEDPPRRLKNRLKTILGDEPASPNLALVTELPPMPHAVDLIDGWLVDHPDARLVVIDVLGKIKPATSAATNAYENDYKILGQLKTLADRHKVAVVAITHMRKLGDGDVFNEISGSVGVTGAADAVIAAKRTRNETSAALHVTGRDIVESEYAITFDPTTCTWSLDGEALTEAATMARQNAVTANLGDRSTQVVAFVGGRAKTTAADLADHLNVNTDQARTYLSRAADAGRIERNGRGVYVSVPSVASVISAGQERQGNGTENGTVFLFPSGEPANGTQITHITPRSERDMTA